jgi:hypothetical protein
MKRSKCSILFLLSFFPILYSFGSSKVDSSDIYGVTVPKHPPGLYGGGPITYVIFGIAVVMLAVFGYFYWKNGMRND